MCQCNVSCGGLSSAPPAGSSRPRSGPHRFPGPPQGTYHHHECRNPGGSPSVMFFSHRICKRDGRGWPLRGGRAGGTRRRCWGQDQKGPGAQNTPPAPRQPSPRQPPATHGPPSPCSSPLCCPQPQLPAGLCSATPGPVLTSERKVCADFWAPTCSRYSYTYSANLQETGQVTPGPSCHYRTLAPSPQTGRASRNDAGKSQCMVPMQRGACAPSPGPLGHGPRQAWVNQQGKLLPVWHECTALGRVGWGWPSGSQPRAVCAVPARPQAPLPVHLRHHNPSIIQNILRRFKSREKIQSVPPSPPG